MELNYCTATELAQLIRDREVSVIQVIRAFLNQIEKYNPKLKAIISVNKDSACDQAAKADAALTHGELWGPLHGVPITFKDIFATPETYTATEDETASNHVSIGEATVITRMRDAGAIILGRTKTSMRESDIQINNPWDLSCTPGVSSGGEAAAVAAGFSPLGLAGDLGGSVRFPAHCCGIVGLKTTEGRVSSAGTVPSLPGDYFTLRHLIARGALARSVDDLRLCLSVIAGPDSRDFSIPPVPLNGTPKRPLSQYKIAWTDNFADLPLSLDTKAALSQLAGDLAGEGCRVEYVSSVPGFEFYTAWKTFGQLIGFARGPETSFLKRVGFRLFGTLLFQDLITGEASRIAMLDLDQYFKSFAQREKLIVALENFLRDYDAWLCPVAPGPAFKHQTGKFVEIDGQRIPYWTACLAYTSVFNLTGNPVVVLPLAQSKHGLPIGVQLVGPRWGEMELLNVADSLLEFIGPVPRPPGY